MMAKTDTTTLSRFRRQLFSCVRCVDGRPFVPTPCVEGGDDRFHGCGSGEDGDDEEIVGKRGSFGLVWCELKARDSTFNSDRAGGRTLVGDVVGHCS